MREDLGRTDEEVAQLILHNCQQMGETPQAAADAVMAEVRALGGTGGVIVAAPGGEAVWSFTTPGMYRARATAAGVREVAVYGDE